MHSYNQEYNGIVYGISPDGVMISRAGFQFLDSQCKREFMATPETPSPRNALAVLHQAVNTPS